MSRLDDVNAVLATYRALFRMGRRPVTPLAVDLPDGGFVDNATGWKAAYLVDPIAGRFAGLNNGRFRIDDTARCETHDHIAPHTGCRCGFHVFSERSSAERVWKQRWGTVLLNVELYGEIVQHASGARGAQQVVTEITFPGRCEHGRCSAVTIGARQSREGFVGACQTHLGDGYCLEDIASLLGIPVSVQQ